MNSAVAVAPEIATCKDRGPSCPCRLTPEVLSEKINRNRTVIYPYCISPERYCTYMVSVPIRFLLSRKNTREGHCLSGL